MTERTVCTLCGEGTYDRATDVAKVHSNVRRWVADEFTVWRCHECDSLHCLEVVELERYYREYPYRQRRLDAFTRRVFSQYARRLRRHGLTNTSAVLDYGCSDGLLLAYLRETGVEQCAGYDPYVEEFSDTSVLAREYDVVIAQDVIEHVESPADLLRDVVSLVRPGGLTCLGTPSAEAIRLDRAERSIHSLHQPYHIHILSERALLGLASGLDLEVVKVYRRNVLDTPYPFTNWRFLHAYLRKLDNTLDAGFDEPRIGMVARSPTLLFTGLLGYLFPLRSELLVLFGKPD